MPPEGPDGRPGLEPRRKRRTWWARCRARAKTARTCTSSRTACSPKKHRPPARCRALCARRTPNSRPTRARRCNLYLERYNEEAGEWEAPRFIARLSQEDQPDWGGSGSFSLGALTSRVSPNGRYLAFMSKEPLTGYDNVDQSPAAHGARDEEVYLYDAQRRRSRAPRATRAGPSRRACFDREASGEGKGLLVDRFGVWKETEGGRRRRDAPCGRPLARRLDPRVGRRSKKAPPSISRATSQTKAGCSSTAPTRSSPHDENGKEDVYEYEPQGLGSCAQRPGCVALISSGESEHEAAFLDASESGNDVFFLTSQPLVAADHDTSFDVYDARVCSEASPCITPPPRAPQAAKRCETCRPARPHRAVLPGASGSALPSASGRDSPPSQTTAVENAASNPSRSRARRSSPRRCEQCRTQAQALQAKRAGLRTAGAQAVRAAQTRRQAKTSRRVSRRRDSSRGASAARRRRRGSAVPARWPRRAGAPRRRVRGGIWSRAPRRRTCRLAAKGGSSSPRATWARAKPTARSTADHDHRHAAAGADRDGDLGRRQLPRRRTADELLA